MTNILFAQMLCSRRLTACFESQPVFLRRETENKKKKRRGLYGDVRARSRRSQAGKFAFGCQDNLI